MRVLVTGGAGFVGANLVRRLDASHVRVVDSLVAGTEANLPDAVDLAVCDIRDGEALARALDGVVAVVHLAAAGSVVESVSDPVANFDVNVRGTLRVLEAVRAAGVERVVLASTGGALIGDAVPPVDERSLPRPLSPYGASKAAGEAYAHAYARSYGLRTVCLRFANVYGPYSAHKKGAVPVFFRALAQGRPLQIYGDGGASRDFMHVDDICAAIEAALVAEVKGGTVVHVATGVETSVGELAQLCAEVSGRPGHPVAYQPPRAAEVQRNFASYDLAQRLLGFTPRVRLRDGLARTWQWYEEHVFARASGHRAVAP